MLFKKGTVCNNLDIYFFSVYFIYIGKLTAKCAGPHKQKVPVTLQENMDGTKRVSFKPIETGRHTLSIKYNKEHVLGKRLFENIKFLSIYGVSFIMLSFISYLRQ